MLKSLILRIADSKKEPVGTVIDSDDVCHSKTMDGILKMIPVFNIIYSFWSENNVQFDTVFESLKQCDSLLTKLQEHEDQEKKYINTCIINFDEELRVIPLAPLKEMLVLYKKYRETAGINLVDNDMEYIKEYFYEFVRRNHFFEKNSRLNSVVFYENLEVASTALRNNDYHKTGRLYQVDFVETRSIDRYDGQWLSDIKPTFIFKECLDAIKNYWSGSMTSNPKAEYLFSGKYLLRELK